MTKYHVAPPLSRLYLELSGLRQSPLTSLPELRSFVRYEVRILMVEGPARK